MASRTDIFLARFQEKAPAFVGELLRTAAARPDSFAELADPMLLWAEHYLGNGWQDLLIDGYCQFVVDVNRSQMAYEKRGGYEFLAYDEVRGQTYDSTDFMSAYHWGVYVTTFGWGHHVRLYEFFRDEFLARLATDDQPRTLIDLGAGSGIWHMLALGRLPGWTATAVDISPTSVQLSNEMAARIGITDKVQHICGDALAFRPQDTPADAGISCFLMEHLEQPQALLENLAAGLGDRAWAFVTCALTAAETDHIFEFRRESEPQRMAEDAGFRVVATMSCAPKAAPARRTYLPRSMAMLLQKRRGDIW